MFKDLFIVNLLSGGIDYLLTMVGAPELGWGPGSVEPVEPAVATPLVMMCNYCAYTASNVCV